MTNRLLAIGGILVLLGYFALLVLPVSSIPLLDANRQVLVQDERGATCAGQVYAETRGAGDIASMAECEATSTVDHTINHLEVQPGFCRGLISKGFPVGQTDCEFIMDENRLWPTAVGNLTDAWNQRFPYPGGLLKTATPSNNNESRTGDRGGNEREGFGRG